MATVLATAATRYGKSLIDALGDSQMLSAAWAQTTQSVSFLVAWKKYITDRETD
jgi:hypothetical protein